MDNCSAHGQQYSLPKLQNVEFIFLPPNTTSKVQPMDAGIIRAMKLRYRKLQLERALDLTQEDICAGNIHRVDILMATQWFKQIWLDLPKQLIAICFKTTDLLGETYESGNTSVPALPCDGDLSNQNIEGDVHRLISTLVPAASLIIIADILSSAEEIDFEETLEEDDYVDNIVQSIQERDDHRDENTSHNLSNDGYIALPPIKEQLKAIAIVKRVTAEHEELIDP